MTSRRVGLALLAAGLATATTIIVACSSDDSSNPGPVNVFDSGPQSDNYVPTVDSGTVDSSTGPQTDGNTTQPDATQVVIDANLPDVGSCTSDASTCNSCYTPAQNPLNGCSSYTVNCIPFDNTRVPAAAP